MAPADSSWGRVYGSLLSWRCRQHSPLRGKPITSQSQTAPSARRGMPGNEPRHFAWVDGTPGGALGACFGPQGSNRFRWKGPEVKGAWPDCYRSLANRFGSGESLTKLIVMDACWGQFTCRWQKKGRVPKIITGFQWAAIGPLRANGSPLSASL